MTNSAELPQDTAQILDTLRRLKPTYAYQPDSDTSVETKTVIPLVGPSLVGKSALMNKVLELAPEFSTIGSRTTRARRAEDPATYQTANEGITHASMLDDVEHGRLLNFSVFDTGHVYGTSPENVGEYAIGPILSDSIAEFAGVGFRELAPVFVVADGDVLRQRIEHDTVRDGITKRLNEGLSSTAFARMNVDANWLHFIDTGTNDESLTHAANTVIRIAYQHTGPIMTRAYKLEYLDEMDRTMQNALRQLP